ncbi:hypothetical protein RS030_6836 [Cryptosporidium xiaoi]|uniref:RanBP2-type domain-containing protein n=1 Tax=Cryptosporidium xiaoi TaxID=659607 RepID=A0AAV9XUB9_9CRYT
MAWKCEVCLVTNDVDAKICVCCEYPRGENENSKQNNAVVFNANLNLSDSCPVFTFGAPTHNKNSEVGVTNFSIASENGGFSDKQTNPSFLTSNFTGGFVPKIDNSEPTPTTPINTPLLKETDSKEEECDKYHQNFNSEFLEYKKLVCEKPIVCDDEANTEIRYPLGSVWVWGSGECDQLGIKESLLDDDLSLKAPMKISDLSDKYNIVDICSGALHNIILTDDGEVISWGCNDDGALGRISLKLEKKLERRRYTDGNEDEELEEDDDEDDLLEDKYPNKVKFTNEESVGNVKVKSIVSGDCYSCCLTNNGEVYLWGSYKDSGGYIGFPNYDTMCGSIVGYKQYKPVKIPIFGVDNNSQNKRRKITKKDKLNVDSNLNFLERAIKIVGGENHTIVITENNRIFAWGSTEFGQYGIEPVVDNKDYDSEMNKTKYLYPTELTNKTLGFDDYLVIQDVFCGRASTFFVVINKRINKIQIYSCGRNGRNELGVCSYNNENTAGRSDCSENDPIVPVPKKVRIDDFDTICSKCESNRPIKSIGGGQYYSALLTCCGDVYIWGMKECCGLEMCRTDNGKMSNVNSNDRDIKTPTRIDHLKEVNYLGFGADNCFAIDKNGLIFTWGLNLTGQIGIKKFENTEAVLNPHIINPSSFSDGLMNSKDREYYYALKVTGGSQHSIALIWNGLYCDKQDNKKLVSSERTELRRMNAKSFEDSNFNIQDELKKKQSSLKKSNTGTKPRQETKLSRSSSKKVSNVGKTVLKDSSKKRTKGDSSKKENTIKSSKPNNKTKAKTSETKAKDTKKESGIKTTTVKKIVTKKEKTESKNTTTSSNTKNVTNKGAKSNAETKIGKKRTNAISSDNTKGENSSPVLDTSSKSKTTTSTKNNTTKSSSSNSNSNSKTTTNTKNNTTKSSSSNSNSNSKTNTNTKDNTTKSSSSNSSSNSKTTASTKNNTTKSSSSNSNSNSNSKTNTSTKDNTTKSSSSNSNSNSNSKTTTSTKNNTTKSSSSNSNSNSKTNTSTKNNTTKSSSSNSNSNSNSKTNTSTKDKTTKSSSSNSSSNSKTTASTKNNTTKSISSNSNSNSKTTTNTTKNSSSGSRSKTKSKTK